MPDDTVVTDDLARRTGLPRARPSRAGADAREDPVGPSVRRRPGLRRVPGDHPAAARRPARRRPHHGAVLRPPRPRPTRSTARSASTSGGGTSTTSAATRWSSTGGPSISSAFYRASRDRRRWASRCAAGSASTAARLTAYEDEHLADPAEADAGAARSSPTEIERPRVGPMRDIVATIQPEQDEIVRADVGDDGLRAGRAGHRQDRRRPAPGGVPALRLPRPAARGPACSSSGPTAPSSTTSARCCPRSARSRSRQTTVDELVAARPPVRGDGRRPRSPSSRATRGWPRCCDRAVWAHVRSRRPSRSSCPAALATLAGARHTRSREVVDELRARGRPLRRGRGGAPAAARAPRAARRWSAPATRPTTGCRTRSPVSGRCARTSTRSGRRSTRQQVLFGLLLATPTSLAAARRRAPRRPTSSELLLWPTAARGPKGAAQWSAADAGAARRGGRPARAHAEPRATSCSTRRRTSRRCSCARSAAAARPGRPPCSATSPRARRRGRPTSWATSLAPPRASRTATSRCSTAGFRVPAVGHRLRRPPAAPMAPGLGRAGVGAREPGPARPGRACRRRPSRPRSARSWRAAPAEPGSVGVIAPDAVVDGGVGVVDRGRHRARRARRRPRRTSTTRSTLVPATRGQGPGVRPGRGRRAGRDRRGRAGRAHRAAPALRRAHPRRLGADRRALDGPAGRAEKLCRPATEASFQFDRCRPRVEDSGPPGNAARTRRQAGRGFAGRLATIPRQVSCR